MASSQPCREAAAASMGGTQRVECFDRRFVVGMAVIKGRRLNTSRYVASLVAGAHIPRHKLGWCASIIMRKAGTADTRRTEERLFGASVSPMAGVGVPAAVEAEAQTRGLAWHSVPCVTCCPMCADGDADALWRGIPVHCRGGRVRGCRIGSFAWRSASGRPQSLCTVWRVGRARRLPAGARWAPRPLSCRSILPHRTRTADSA